MQCKNIPDHPILEFVWGRNNTSGWCNWIFDDESDVRKSMPPLPNEKIALAKMRQLIRRGLISGCGCGCRGDFEITNKGCEMIGRGKPEHRFDY